LRLEAVGLDFHEVVVAADDVLVPTRDLRRLPHLPLDQEARDLGVETPREDDEPVGVLGEELTVHPGLVVEALEVGLRDQLDEMSKTTRFTPWTSLLRRLLMRPSRS